jgi:hypothetical protein
VICSRCCKKRRPSKQDASFCQPCLTEIEANLSRQMDRARAARCYLDTGRQNKKLEVAAFLSVFHPEMSNTQTQAIISATEDSQ